MTLDYGVWFCEEGFEPALLARFLNWEDAANWADSEEFEKDRPEVAYCFGASDLELGVVGLRLQMALITAAGGFAESAAWLWTTQVERCAGA